MSPLLANVLLDEVDKELELRGHAFVRYADDCNVYVRSRRAGQRVMQALRHLYGKLRLQVNEEKSAVARVWDRQFLGYSFWVAAGKVVKRPGQQEGPDEVQGASPADYKPEWRAEPATGGGRATALRAGVEGILRLSGYTGGFPRPGPMDPPPAAYVAITPVETGKDSVPGVEGSRCEPRTSPGELLGSREAGGTWPRTTPCTRPCQGRTSTSWVCPGSRRTDLNSPNRQVRTRMPGGVGGEGPGSPVLPYPDCEAWPCVWSEESLTDGGSTEPDSRGQGWLSRGGDLKEAGGESRPRRTGTG